MAYVAVLSTLSHYGFEYSNRSKKLDLHSLEHSGRADQILLNKILIAHHCVGKSYVPRQAASLVLRNHCVSVRWVLRSFVSDREVVRKVGREFQRKRPENAKADIAKVCLTRVKKKGEKEDDRKPSV
ncbi:hypothetical protein HELRODRAFT_180133 [Helobdella robusta]|uniref:Uncharacterized protein n=1 Tax=Helobdella robusta TaxID=6412 RepID=T1FFI2_HELRO|nr:hypothetical protein HELRODRAFT_180133 [Helobdella robusta]ESN94791.1 hypothetical protein HELRODRAFT_180133 [Helobdella robusta]